MFFTDKLDQNVCIIGITEDSWKLGWKHGRNKNVTQNVTKMPSKIYNLHRMMEDQNYTI